MLFGERPVGRLQSTSIPAAVSVRRNAAIAAVTEIAGDLSGEAIDCEPTRALAVRLVGSGSSG
jgi:hypothetical protein